MASVVMLDKVHYIERINASTIMYLGTLGTLARNAWELGIARNSVE